MCGVIHLGGTRFEIDCLLVDPFWWRHPDPPIDLTRFTLDQPSAGPRPEPWKIELTKIGEMLATVGQFRDAELSNRLGNAVSEAGNSIAEQAEANVRFEWTPHELTN
jgi:hypothetical protein